MLVLRERIELSTSSLPMRCSTTELPQQGGRAQSASVRPGGGLADRKRLGNRLIAWIFRSVLIRCDGEMDLQNRPPQGYDRAPEISVWQARIALQRRADDAGEAGLSDRSSRLRGREPAILSLVLLRQ